MKKAKQSAATQRVPAVKPQEKRLYSVGEAATYLGSSKQTLYNKTHSRSQDRFPVQPVRVGKKPMFRKEDLDSYIDNL